MTIGHKEEVTAGNRFEFGANWNRFLTVLNDERIAEAENSLRTMLETDRLDKLNFLDVGSGSGLFSLAARRLGATVHSFDYDPQSVACTSELRHRYFSDDPRWVVQEGSVLDERFLAGLGQFDIVYSWGVLHHTGDMWRALENVGPLVRDGGRLYIAIYNDQGDASVRWKRLKRTYVRAPLFGKWIVGGVYVGSAVGYGWFADLLRLRNPLRRYSDYWKRGMSRWHDWIDWIGGYPFEVAKPEEIFDFFRARGFILQRLRTCGGGLGNNEFVFLKHSGS